MGIPLSIALDATPLLGPKTGVGEFCSGALAGLAARGDVKVAAFAVSWRRRGRMDALLPSAVRPVTRPMPARPVHRLWSMTDHPVIERWTGPLDLVHGTNYVVPPARRAARVVTVHDLTTVRFPEMCDPSTLVFPRLVRRAVARGAWVHTPSAFVAAEVAELLDVPPERVRAVHHGIPAVAQRVPHVPLESVLPPEARRYVLSVGTIEPRKDLPLLVAAFDELAGSAKGGEEGDLWLVVAGREGWGMPAFEKAIERASPAARRRIHRTGYVDARSRTSLVAGAAVFAYPSVYEGFGFPPLEAMAAGVPVVATRAGAVPEVVGEAALLLDPGDVDGFAAALTTALVPGPAREALVARGKERVGDFSWDACAQGLVALYRDAIGSGR